MSATYIVKMIADSDRFKYKDKSTKKNSKAQN